jgi:hypothetical protein
VRGSELQQDLDTLPTCDLASESALADAHAWIDEGTCVFIFFPVNTLHESPVKGCEMSRVAFSVEGQFVWDSTG